MEAGRSPRGPGPSRRGSPTAPGSSSAPRAAATGRPGAAAPGRRRSWPSRWPARPGSGSSRSRPRPSRSAGTGRVASSASRARIQFRLPRMVLISPLCAMNRYGWASGQDGNVFVENRECTSASADVYRGSDRSGKNALQLRRGQHALVDDGRAPTGWRSSSAGLVLGPLAQAERPPVQVDARLAGRPGHEQLGQLGQHGPGAARRSAPGRAGRRASPGRSGPPSPPAARWPPPPPARLLGAGGQEHQAGRVAAGGGSSKSHTARKSSSGIWVRMPGAVAGVRVAALGAAVIQVAQHGQRFGHGVVAAAAGQVSDEADAAGVVLVAAVVQALSRRARRAAGAINAPVVSSAGIASGSARRDDVGPADLGVRCSRDSALPAVVLARC